MKTPIKIAIVGAVVFIGLIIGAVWGVLTRPGPTIVRETLPDRVAVTEEYAIAQLNANVSGTIESIASDSVKLKTAQGTSLTTYYSDNGISTFVDAETNQPIAFTSLAVGDKLDGGVSIVTMENAGVGGTAGKKLGDIVLHYMLISKE